MAAFEDKRPPEHENLEALSGGRLRTFLIPAFTELAASPRYLEILDTLLEAPERAGAEGIRAVIETLESKHQINDPVPAAMVKNYETRFVEHDAELSCNAHYLFRVQKGFGDESLVTGVGLILEGISDVSSPIDQNLIGALHERTNPFLPPWVKLPAQERILLPIESFSMAKFALSISSSSIEHGFYLKREKGRIFAEAEAFDQRRHRIGSHLGKVITPASAASKSKIKLLTERSNGSTTGLSINNISSQPAYLYIQNTAY